MSTARRIGLAAICCGFLMITLDVTIVNVALGPIVKDLGGSLSGAQWIVSAYTLGVATFLLSGGFILAGSLGWGSPRTIGLLVAGVAAALGLIGVERLVRLPMIPPELFRNHQFRSVVIVGGIYNFGVYGTLFCLSLLFHEQLGLSPFDTGLALLPLTAVIGVIAAFSAQLIGRLGEWRAVLIGLWFGVAGAALLAIFGGHSVATTIVCSVPFAGTALTMQAMTALAMEGAPVERIGLAAGVQNAARQAGGALGVALLGTLLAAGHGLALHLPMAVVSAGYLLSIGLTLAGRGAAPARGAV
jgi:DHA2 family methylenomycin A resistance protein-like MFS transporter